MRRFRAYCSSATERKPIEALSTKWSVIDALEKAAMPESRMPCRPGDPHKDARQDRQMRRMRALIHSPAERIRKRLKNQEKEFPF
jgi:hypothetical protein